MLVHITVLWIVLSDYQHLCWENSIIVLTTEFNSICKIELSVIRDPEHCNELRWTNECWKLYVSLHYIHILSCLCFKLRKNNKYSTDEVYWSEIGLGAGRGPGPARPRTGSKRNGEDVGKPGEPREYWNKKHKLAPLLFHHYKKWFYIE